MPSQGKRTAVLYGNKTKEKFSQSCCMRWAFAATRCVTSSYSSGFPCTRCGSAFVGSEKALCRTFCIWEYTKGVITFRMKPMMKLGTAMGGLQCAIMAAFVRGPPSAGNNARGSQECAHSCRDAMSDVSAS